MAATHRLTLAFVSAAALTATSAFAASAAFQASEPSPLRQRALIRVQDVAADGQVMAVGWREAAGTGAGLLRIALSTDGGASFLRGNGKLRFYSVEGQARRGLALDTCRERIWAASVARAPGDASGDTDVLISRRIVGGAAGQAFVTSPGESRRVRQVDVACAGGKLLAVAWLERGASGMRARLLVRDQATLAPAATIASGTTIAPATTNRLFELGPARARDGIAVAATGRSIYVAWSTGGRRDLQLARLEIGSGVQPTITRRANRRLATRDAGSPRLAARGQKVALAYTDDGKLKARVSGDGGRTFGSAHLLLGAGTLKVPSFATSADLSGRRIVVEALRKEPSGADQQRMPVRLESHDGGESWSGPAEFGNRGPRMGALQKLSASASRLKEAWHDDGTIDVLRAQREVS